MVSELSVLLGQDRAFELLEFLIVLFVIVSLTTLAFLLISEVRSRRAVTRTNRRLEEVVRYLGRNLLGADGWEVFEHLNTKEGKRLDSLVSLFDPEGFEEWMHSLAERGLLSSEELDAFKQRLNRQPGPMTFEASQPTVPECVPTAGMPVAISQNHVHARGTISNVSNNSFTIWLISNAEKLTDGEAASLLLLSRRGPYRFSARMRKGEDGSIVVERPTRILRNQRRRFGRYPTAIPAAAKPYLSEEEPAEATVRELSGGGATITNPGGRFQSGNVLELTFASGRQRYTVAGRVVRTSDDDELLHVRFEAMKDQQRVEIAESLVLS